MMVLDLTEDNIKEDIKNGKRPDGRGFKDYRDIEIIPNYIHESAEGSAYVKIGDTQVLVGVKIDTGEPFPDRPDEGTLITNTELVPLASPEYESGPPGEEAVEIARVVDRGIRESGMIKLTDLSIEEGEKVWMVFVDIHVLDYDGNLLDAASLGAVAALMNTEIPEHDEEEDVINREEVAEKLDTQEVPVTVTARKIGGKLLFDTTSEEEEVLDSRLTVTFKENGNVCSIQKGEETPLKLEEIEEMVEESYEKSQELREELEKSLEE